MLGQLEHQVGMVVDVLRIPGELGSQVDGKRRLKGACVEGLLGAGTGHRDAETARAQMLQAFLPRGPAHDVQPLVGALDDRVRDPKRTQFLDDVDFLEPEALAGAQHRRDVVGIVEVLQHEGVLAGALGYDLAHSFQSSFGRRHQWSGKVDPGATSRGAPGSAERPAPPCSPSPRW